MTEAPLPGLRIVVTWSDRRNLCTLVAEALEALAGADEVRELGDDAFVVHTALTPAELRDTLHDRLEAGENVFVAGFEVWSAFGSGVDARWLLRRGH